MDGTVRQYWTESARPLTSLVFISPLLLLYELGVVLLGPHAMRNGADVWLRAALEQLGFGQYFLLPLLTCGLLLGWHHLQQQAWRPQWPLLGPMVLESVVLATALLIAAQWIGAAISYAAAVCGGHPPACAIALPPPVMQRFISYLGAGIYEELLFRLILLSLCTLVLQAMNCSRISSLVWAIAITSLLFAAAHYQIEFSLLGYRVCLPAGEPFSWASFVFRVAAGAFFGGLFVTRGFGIVVGAHAVYDVLVLIG